MMSLMSRLPTWSHAVPSRSNCFTDRFCALSGARSTMNRRPITPSGWKRTTSSFRSVSSDWLSLATTTKARQPAPCASSLLSSTETCGGSAAPAGAARSGTAATNATKRAAARGPLARKLGVRLLVPDPGRRDPHLNRPKKASSNRSPLAFKREPGTPVKAGPPFWLRGERIAAHAACFTPLAAKLSPEPPAPIT